eukprot:CAMPEP_0203863778 /NCGR_PEP_ID=MMETSP0359-20131031/14369_1 /ASSEMBLY_ACC=CAM_ASM_000338 /TAXON_ID=268821 /ORGANISM="Scrippsiella Hangoei, Strain SHTV-5" /LENGTH=920 /DNA_ID=CAMNT_0050781393 /DNA_START=99 /DNA_END=2861 /DNA_ORIENTATION=-
MAPIGKACWQPKQPPQAPTPAKVAQEFEASASAVQPSPPADQALSKSDLARLEKLFSQRVSFDPASGWLLVRLGHCRMQDKHAVALARHLETLLPEPRRPQGPPLAWSGLELENNSLSDVGLKAILDVCDKRRVYFQRICLYKNRLTDASGERLAALIWKQESPVDELHLSHNKLTGRALIAICMAIAGSQQYPRCTDAGLSVPCWLRIEHNKVERPAEVMKVLRNIGGISICEAYDRHYCNAHHCVSSESEDTAQVHLFAIDTQHPSEEGAAQFSVSQIRACVRELMAKGPKSLAADDGEERSKAMARQVPQWVPKEKPQEQQEKNEPREAKAQKQEEKAQHWAKKEVKDEMLPQDEKARKCTKKEVKDEMPPQEKQQKKEDKQKQKHDKSQAPQAKAKEEKQREEKLRQELPIGASPRFFAVSLCEAQANDDDLGASASGGGQRTKWRPKHPLPQATGDAAASVAAMVEDGVYPLAFLLNMRTLLLPKMTKRDLAAPAEVEKEHKKDTAINEEEEGLVSPNESEVPVLLGRVFGGVKQSSSEAPSRSEKVAVRPPKKVARQPDLPIFEEPIHMPSRPARQARPLPPGPVPPGLVRRAPQQAPRQAASAATVAKPPPPPPKVAPGAAAFTTDGLGHMMAEDGTWLAVASPAQPMPSAARVYRWMCSPCGAPPEPVPRAQPKQQDSRFSADAPAWRQGSRLSVDAPAFRQSSRMSADAVPFHPPSGLTGSRHAKASSSGILGREVARQPLETTDEKHKVGRNKIGDCPSSPATTCSSAAGSSAKLPAYLLDDQQALLHEARVLKHLVAQEEERQRIAAKDTARLSSALQEAMRLSSGAPASLWSAIELAASIGWQSVQWKRDFTALHLAAYEGCANAVPLVLALRADLASRDWKGRTALDVARSAGHEECAEVLAKLQAA